MGATRELLGETGFTDLTVERVAERSGVHKTTIYRRWGSRAGLVGAALAAQGQQEVPIPDTGDLRADLAAIARSVGDNLASPLGRAMAQALVGHADDPEIAGISEDFWGARFAATAVVVERAVERGELPPDADPRLAVELVVAAIWFRSIVTREPVADDLLATVVEVIVGGLAGPG